MKIVKGMGREPRECFLLEDGRHLVPKGIFFIKRIQGKQLSFCFNLIPSQLPYRPTSVSNYTYVALHFHLSTSGKLHFCHKTFPPHRISLDYAQSLLFRKICRVPCRTLGVRCTKSRYWIPPPLWNKCTIEFFFYLQNLGLMLTVAPLSSYIFTTKTLMSPRMKFPEIRWLLSSKWTSDIRLSCL